MSILLDEIPMFLPNIWNKIPITMHYFYPRHLFSILIALLFSANLVIGQESITFMATDGTTTTPSNDASITLNWTIPVKCLLDDNNTPSNSSDDFPYENGVYLVIEADGVSIYEEEIFQEVATEVQGSEIHKVGPDAEIDYTIYLYEIGPANDLCAGPKSAVGKTAGFQEITNLTATTGAVENIILNWKNNSKLTTRYILYRKDLSDPNAESIVVANIDKEDEPSFIDEYRFNDSTSIQNGVEYEYCIEIFSEITNQTHGRTCKNGETYDLDLQATYDIDKNEVNLTWEPIFAGFWDNFRLLRDGEVLETPQPDQTTYTDVQPTPGKRNIYSLETIKDNAALTQDTTGIDIPLNGEICGKVVTQLGLYPVENVPVTLSIIVGSDPVEVVSTTTNFDGTYCFQDVFYDRLSGFEISVDREGFTYENSPLDAVLLVEQAEAKDKILYQEQGFEVVPDVTVDVTSFTGRNNDPDNTTPIEDKVILDWEYTKVPNEVTFFNLYRGGTLIAALNDNDLAASTSNETKMFTYTDTAGRPAEDFRYRLVAFRITADNQVIRTVLDETVGFPVVTPPTNLAIDIDANAIVNLTWNMHSSDNFAGFHLYRNGELLTTLANDIETYTDLYVEPGKEVHYSLRAYRIAALDDREEEFESVELTVSGDVPVLPAAVNPMTDLGADIITISWEVPEVLVSDGAYNYTGFAVYRTADGSDQKELVDIKYKDFVPDATTWLTDKTVSLVDYQGQPSINYTYEICTFLLTPDTTYHANAINIGATFPAVTSVAERAPNINIGDNFVELFWEKPNSQNIDGITIFKDGEEIVTLDANANQYLYETPNKNQEHTYEVKAYRRVNGEIFYADDTIERKGTATYTSADVRMPEKFTASDDLPNVIKICWEYPPFALSTFKIYKNKRQAGNSELPIFSNNLADADLIAELPTTARAFYDYDAPRGQQERYIILAEYEGDESTKAVAFGYKSCANRLSGRVYTQNKQAGVPNTRVRATNDDYTAYAVTDVTGYYEITNLPAGDYTIEVENSNANWETQSVNDFPVNCTDKEYTQNFTSTYDIPAFESDGLAVPLAVQVVPNEDLIQVAVSWTPGSQIYDGFEVRRGTTFLGEVGKDEDYIWVDSDGAPGYLATYQVRAFTEDANGNRTFSEGTVANISYPILQPVSFLTASPVKDKNQVSIQWAHPQDADLTYEIRRNDLLVETLENPSRLTFIDPDGVPNTTYRYSVTAVYANGAGTYPSDEQFIDVAYERMIRPEELEVEFITRSIDVSEDCTNNNIILPRPLEFSNEILLNWTYPEMAADSFEVFRTDISTETTTSIGKITGEFTILGKSFLTDTLPLYGKEVNYELKAIVNRDGENRYSRGKKVLNFDTPKLTAPYNYSTISQPGRVEVNFKYKIPDPKNARFILYRSTQDISDPALLSNDDILKVYDLPLTNLTTYVDKDGLPGDTYYYYFQTQVEHSGELFTSDLKQCQATFGALPVPDNVQASDDKQTVIELTWEYDSEVTADEFIIQRSTSSSGSYSPIATILGTERSYTQVFSLGASEYNQAKGGGYYYKVIAKKIDGNSSRTALSDPSSAVLGKIKEKSLTVPIDDPNIGANDVSIDDTEDIILIGSPKTHTNQDNSSFYGYELEGTEWNRKYSGVVNNDRYAYSIDLSYPYFIAGDVNEVYLYKFKEENGTQTYDRIGNRVGDGGFYGHSVGVAEEQIIVGTPNINTNKGLVYHYKIDENSSNNGDNQVGAITFSNSPDCNGSDLGSGVNPKNGDGLGYDVAIHKKQIIVGQPAIGTSDFGKVYIYTQPLNNSCGSQHHVFAPESSNQLGVFVDIYEDYAIASGDNGAYIYKKTTSDWTTVAQKLGDRSENANHPVAIHNGLAVVMYKNIANVYKENMNGDWNKVAEFTANYSSNPNAPEGAALAADMSGKFLVTSGQAHWYVFNLIATPESFTASDDRNNNTEPERENTVELAWAYTEVAEIAGFKIYRDNQLIKTVGALERDYTDDEAIAGKEHFYEIEPYINTDVSGEDDLAGRRLGTKGYHSPNGIISGTVNTAFGNAPVAGVTITATATISGINYEYTVTTDASGAYSIENIYYGESANYTLEALFGDHDIVLAPSSSDNIAELETDDATETVDFLDKSTFGIEGVVSFAATNCLMEDIEVTLTEYRSGNNQGIVSPPVKTNSRGEYQIDFPNDLSTIDRVTIEVKNKQKINISDDPDNVGQNIAGDDITYEFKAIVAGQIQASNLYEFNQAAIDNLARSNRIDFQEETTYEVAVDIINSCEDLVFPNQGTTDRTINLRVRTIDGCLDQIFTVGNENNTISLPPLNDLIINVEGVSNPAANSSELLALDYLENRPTRLQLFDYHQEKETNPDLATPNFKVIYHRPAQISISAFDEYMCSQNETNIAIINQGDPYTNTVTVTERFGTQDCSVKGGYVVVTNPGAVKIKDTLDYLVDTNGFEEYFFVGGAPNLVSPHIWIMKMEYFSASGDFLGEQGQALFVTGVATLPGNDVVVEPTAIPTPLYILRDPPGDGSSTSITSGQKISKQITYKGGVSTDNSFGFDFKTEIFGAGTKTNVTIQTDEAGSITNSYNISIDINETISTSGSAGKVGEPADIIVGAGIAYQYGIAEEIKFGGCENGQPIIERFVTFSMAPNGITTTFIQTVADIEKTIEINRNALEALTTKPESEVTKEDREAIAKFETSLVGFEDVLAHHRDETLPINYLCNDLDRFIENVTEAQSFNYTVIGADFGPIFDMGLVEIKQWRDNFCTFKDRPEYQDENGNLKWDDNLLQAYSNTINAIRILSDPILVRDDLRTEAWFFHDNRGNDNFGNLGGSLQIQRDALADRFGKPGENITFGGGTTLTKTMNVGYSHANSFNFSANASGSLKNSIGFGKETIIENGLILAPVPGAGTFLSAPNVVTNFEKTFTLNNKIKVQYSSDAKTSEANTHKVSYKLSDNDTGDQFSVNVLQPLEYNHTPSFVLVGGRSSCPPEVGTIERDRPKLQIIEGQGVTQEATQRNIPTDGVAHYQVKIVNTSIYEETRSVVVYLDANTNINGAVIRLSGQLMGSQTFFSLQPNEELVLPLTIERGLTAFQHEGIELKIRPFCKDGNVKWPNPDVITLNAFFENPCSPITISEPANNWVMNGVEDSLLIGLVDYQPTNNILEELRLEYRRTDIGGDDWDAIPSAELSIDLGDDRLSDPCDPVNFPISKECLTTYNDELFVPGQPPVLRVIWKLPEGLTSYADGDYEIRAVAECGVPGESYSNIITGQIRRTALRVRGVPEPADGFWTAGDDIGVEFNRFLDCSLFDLTTFVDTSLYVYHIVDGDSTRITDVTLTCLENGIDFFVPNIENYGGDSLGFALANVSDLSGNIADTVNWAFKVITDDLYWSEDVLEVSMYEGQSLSEVVTIFNNAAGPVDRVHLNGNVANEFGAGLTYETAEFEVAITGRDITFDFVNLAQGEYEDVIQIKIGDSNTIVGEITIRAKVLPMPPDWTVDPVAYTEHMTVVANYEFSDLPGQWSENEMDIISVWLNGEIRGVGHIERSGNTYTAYLAVFGEITEEGEPLEFRVWHAEEGTEYIATTPEPILFNVNTTIGNTQSPLIVTVDRSASVDCIPLNRGWTHFSINKEENNMTLNHIVRSINNPTEGDIIQTGDKFAQYIDGTGWYSEGNDALTSLDVNDGYMIYLAAPDNELCLYGTPTTPTNITLQAGWNWVGYPLLAEQPLVNGIYLSQLETNDIIKTTHHNGVTELTIYDGSDWVKDPDTDLLETISPYNAYKIKLNNSTGSLLNYTETPTGSGLVSPVVTADPTDESTWMMNGFNYEYVMGVVGEIDVNGDINTNTGSLLAAFRGNELRGLGRVSPIEPTGKTGVTMLIGGFGLEDEIEWYFYDANVDAVLPVEGTLMVQENGYGTFNNPHTFKVEIYDIQVDKGDVLCENDRTGFIDLSVTGGIAPYKFQWSTGSTQSAILGLSARDYHVTITDRNGNGLPIARTFTVENTNTPIAAPSVDPASPEVCEHRSVVLTATQTDYPNETMFTWINEAGEIITPDDPNVGDKLTLNNIEQARQIRVFADVRACLSDFQTVDITVRDAAEATFSVDDRTPVVDKQAVTFTPTVQNANFNYQWNFGDGTTSTEMSPKHTYNSSGAFDVLLAITTADGCANAFLQNNYIITDSSQTICDDPDRQMDTDGDGIVDDCDNCIYVHNPDQLDDNNDGLGNECECDVNATNANHIQVVGDIDPKTYLALQTITSNGQVNRGYVEFKAGESITLEAGFSVNGTTFLAQVAEVTNGNGCETLAEEEVTERSITIDPTVLGQHLLTVVPNPFRERTKILYDLYETTQVEIRIQRLTGETVLIPVSTQEQPAGSYEYDFSSGNLPAGIYFVHLSTGNRIITQRMVLLR